ncbi:TetR/AcrR family transcriptional regulator [Bradyrhizobium liaoningense]
MSTSKRAPAKSAKVGSATPKRRTQAERREATRKLILDAAVEVMVRLGTAGLRMEDVEREAGVSRGALLHHFRTKQDLVLATFEHVNDRSLERSQQRIKFAERARSVPAIIDAVLADATEFFFGQGFFIEFALAFGQAYPELRGAVRRLSRRSRFVVEETWQRALESYGLPQAVAADILSLTLNHVRGFMVRRFMDDNPAQRAHLSAVWQDMIRSYLTEKLSAEALTKAMTTSESSDHSSGQGEVTRISRPKKSRARN